MKKYLFIIAGLMALFFSNSVKAQYSQFTPDVNKLIHKMSGDKKDRWTYTAGSGYNQPLDPDFDVWLKFHSANGLAPFVAPSFSEVKTLHYDLYNANALELATTAITRENANNFKYNVQTEDGEELMPWSTPSVFKSSKYTSYAYLGKFDCRHKTIILTISGTQNGEKLWGSYVYNSDNKSEANIKSVMVDYTGGYSAKSRSDWTKGFTIWPTRNPKGLLLGIEQTGQTQLYHVYIIRKFEGKEETTAIGNGWEQVIARDELTMPINSAFFSKPGDYTIVIQPELKDYFGQGQQLTIGRKTEVHFKVPPGPINIPLGTVAAILVGLTILGLRIYFYMRRKQKTAKQAKEIAVLQLQSVRSQLNPHFIFNALAGIQNLMNKNEVENANKYLARFARLTRNVLDDGQKELTPIAQEVRLLTDYLEMEQMRFGFKFDIDVADKVDQQIEIPAMLLQPFAENAVKHGISSLKGGGLVTVRFSQTGNDITLTVADNGSGFSIGTTTGMGIKLCEERIRLLNTVYKNSTILLHINTTNNGTTAIIELKNWL